MCRVIAISRACIRLACNALSADSLCERASMEPSAGMPITARMPAMLSTISNSIKVNPRWRANEDAAMAVPQR